MGYLIAHIQLKQGQAARDQFSEALAEALPDFERNGWKLHRAFINQIGTLNEIWDIWEVEDANAVASLLQNFQQPNNREWSRKLSEVIVSEQLNYVKTLPFSPA